jgi:hypothetical protein
MKQQLRMDEQEDILFGNWWGAVHLDEGEIGHWQVGPMDLWLHRDERDWQFAYVTRNDPFMTDVATQIHRDNDRFPLEGVERSRFSFFSSAGDLYLQPILADRPVISKPETPLYLPPGESVTFYVSSPLWVNILLGASMKPLLDRPIHRPSDTWYGPPTRRGGLGYATKTLALTTLEGYPYSPFHAITPVLIHNRAKNILLIEQVNLPAPYLTLFQARNGTFWTQTMVLEREDEDNQELALLKLSRGAPLEVGVCTVVAKSRRRSDKNLVIRAFSRLFHN